MSLSQKSICDAMSALLAKEGFLPSGAIKLGVRPGSGKTLHEAFRISMGMETDDSIYMYWEWEEIETFISQFWKVIDQAASDVVGRKTTAIALAHDEKTLLSTIQEVISVCRMEPEPVVNTVTRRFAKREQYIRFTGKLLGACFSTMSILEAVDDDGFGDLFSDLSRLSGNDVNLLRELDERIRKGKIDVTRPKTTSSLPVLRALGWALEETNVLRVADDLKTFSLIEFLHEMEQSGNWSGLSDQSILKRLLSIAPETAEGPKGEIEKFLASSF